MNRQLHMSVLKFLSGLKVLADQTFMKMDDEMLYNLVSNFSQVIDGVIHFT